MSSERDVCVGTYVHTYIWKGLYIFICNTYVKS